MSKITVKKNRTIFAKLCYLFTYGIQQHLLPAICFALLLIVNCILFSVTYAGYIEGIVRMFCGDFSYRATDRTFTFQIYVLAITIKNYTVINSMIPVNNLCLSECNSVNLQTTTTQDRHIELVEQTM